MLYRKPCGSVLEAIGNTPLVRLRRVVEHLPVEVFAKLEFMNPMGSSKDRISKYMIEAAERDGRLKPGDMIIENSSGNTATARTTPPMLPTEQLWSQPRVSNPASQCRRSTCRTRPRSPSR